MGKAGRFACIFTPMALTLASLVCLAIVLSGQAYSNDLSKQLYFFKVRCLSSQLSLVCLQVHTLLGGLSFSTSFPY